MTPDLCTLERYATKIAARYGHDRDELQSIGWEAWALSGRTWDPALGASEHVHGSIRAYGAMLDFVRAEAIRKARPKLPTKLAYSTEPALNLVRCIELLSPDDQAALRARTLGDLADVGAVLRISTAHACRRWAEIQERLASIMGTA